MTKLPQKPGKLAQNMLKPAMPDDAEWAQRAEWAYRAERLASWLTRLAADLRSTAPDPSSKAHGAERKRVARLHRMSAAYDMVPQSAASAEALAPYVFSAIDTACRFYRGETIEVDTRTGERRPTNPADLAPPDERLASAVLQVEAHLRAYFGANPATMARFTRDATRAALEATLHGRSAGSRYAAIAKLLACSPDSIGKYQTAWKRSRGIAPKARKKQGKAKPKG